MRIRKLALWLLAGAVALGVAGCGQRVDTPQTEPQTVAQTEAHTEAVTEVQTEAPTEAVTEAATEAPVEEITEQPVEAPEPPVAQYPENLTSEEELELESELNASVEYYVVDDINIRSTPDTENSDNIISSYDQGEKATVIGETANWFKVSKEDWTGYVKKEFLSETAVEPKTPEERSEAADAEAVAAADAADAAPASAAAENDVNSYAENFTIQMASDANLRSEASDQANIIGAVSAGDIITALGETDNWYRVEIDGTVGYVNKSLVG